MFQHLLESNAVRRPRVGGSLISTVGHAALVATAITITAQRVDKPSSMVDPVARFIDVVRPAPPPEPVHGNNSGSVAPAPDRASPPALAVLPTVLDITVGIASPELSRQVIDATEFGARRTPGGIGDGIGTGPIVGEGSAWLADQVDKPVLMLSGVAMPTYPALLRSAGVAGAVLVEFVVDTLGRVEPGSLHVLQSDHDLFTSSVREVAPRLRFIAAEARGRKVRQLVRLPFRFDLNPDAPNTNAGLIRF